MTPSQTKDISGASFWDYMALIMRWRKLFTWVLSLTAVAAVSYALVAQVWYRSDARVLPPPQNGMGLGNILPGLNLGALGPGSLLSNESNLAFSILDSRILRDTVIDSMDWMKREKLTYRIDAYDRYNNLVKWELTEDGAISITVEEKSAQLAKETLELIIRFLEEKYTIVTTAQAGQQREFLGKRLDQNYAAIEAAENAMKDFQERTGVIEVEEQLKASVAAVAQLNTELYMAEVQYDVAKASYPSTSSEVLMAKQKVKSLRGKLNELNQSGEDDAKSFFISINKGPEVGMQFFRLQRELETQGLILQFLVPQYEQARLMELQDESTMFVLDPPNLPDKKSRPKRGFIVIASLIGMFGVLFVLVSFMEWYRLLRIKNPENFEQVEYVFESLKPGNYFKKDKQDRIQ